MIENITRLIVKMKNVLTFALIIFCGGVIYWSASFQALKIFISPTSIKLSTLFEYGQFHPLTKDSLQFIRGKAWSWESQHEGIIIDIQKDGWFEIFIPRAPSGYLNLYFDAWVEGDGEQVLFLENVANKKVHTFTRNKRIAQRKWEITRYVTPHEPFRIVLKTFNAERLGRVIIYGCSLTSVPSVPFFPLIPSLLIGLSFIFLLWHSLDALKVGELKKMLCIVGFLTLLLLGGLHRWAEIGQPWLWIFFLAVVIFYRQLELKPRPEVHVWDHELFLIVFFIALSVRWQILSGSLGLTIGVGNDAADYRDLALGLDYMHPFATKHREPLMVWIQFSVLKIFGYSELHFRLATMMSSLGSVVLTYFLALHISKNKLTALCASLVMAMGWFVLYSSLKGERNDVYAFLILAYCLASIKIQHHGLMRELFLGILGGLTSLVWLIGAFPVFVIYIWRMIKLRVSVVGCFVFLISFFSLVSPHLITNWKTNHDLFFVINYTSNYYRGGKILGNANLELSKNDKWSKFFSERGLGPFIVDVVRGYGNMFLNMNNNFNRSFLGFHYNYVYSCFLFPFFLFGIVLVLYRKQWDIFVFVFALLNIMPAFEDISHPRIFLHAAPFFSIFLGVGVVNAMFGLNRTFHLQRLMAVLR